MRICRNRGCTRARMQPPLSRLSFCVALGLAAQAHAQNCLTPIVATATVCTVPEGTAVTVAANGTGVTASSNAFIQANGISETLTGANAVGVLSQSGSLVRFNGSTVTTTSTAGNASGQIGLRAVGAGSRIEGSVGPSVVMAPGGSSSPANLRGVSAEGGALVALEGALVDVRGGSNVLNNYGVQAVGTGSEVRLTSGGSINTFSRAAFGALALDGGLLTLDGTQITTGGAQNTTTLDGSHSVVVRGAGSRANLQNLAASTTGTLANAVRVDGGGAASVTGSQLSQSGNGNIPDPAAVIRVTSGGSTSRWRTARSLPPAHCRRQGCWWKTRARPPRSRGPGSM